MAISNLQGGWLLAVILFALVVSCGDGSADNTQQTQVASTANALSQATPTLPPLPVATATPNVEIIEIFPTPVDNQSTYAVGTNDWWNSTAPVVEYRAILPVLAGTPNGDAIWSLYAATYVASEWLSGREPGPSAFGPYVANLDFEALPARADALFARIMVLDPASAGWLRPYHLAESDADFTLVVNLGFTACLNIATWNECLDRASDG